MTLRDRTQHRCTFKIECQAKEAIYNKPGIARPHLHGVSRAGRESTFVCCVDEKWVSEVGVGEEGRCVGVYFSQWLYLPMRIVKTTGLYVYRLFVSYLFGWDTQHATHVEVEGQLSGLHARPNLREGRDLGLSIGGVRF